MYRRINRRRKGTHLSEGEERLQRSLRPSSGSRSVDTRGRILYCTLWRTRVRLNREYFERGSFCIKIRSERLRCCPPPVEATLRLTRLEDAKTAPAVGRGRMNVCVCASECAQWWAPGRCSSLQTGPPPPARPVVFLAPTPPYGRGPRPNHIASLRIPYRSPPLRGLSCRTHRRFQPHAT